MSTTGKLILCFAALFCVIQAIEARPRFDGSFIENVKYDLTKKCAKLEKDIDKETTKIKHKLVKDSSKMMKKAIKEGSPECIESARLQAEEQVDEKSQEAQECIQELRDSLDSELQPEASLPEIMTFRNNFKKKLQECKNTGKTEIKAAQKNFCAEAKACLI